MASEQTNDDGRSTQEGDGLSGSIDPQRRAFSRRQVALIAGGLVLAAAAGIAGALHTGSAAAERPKVGITGIMPSPQSPQVGQAQPTPDVATSSPAVSPSYLQTVPDKSLLASNVCSRILTLTTTVEDLGTLTDRSNCSSSVAAPYDVIAQWIFQNGGGSFSVDILNDAQAQQDSLISTTANGQQLSGPGSYAQNEQYYQEGGFGVTETRVYNGNGQTYPAFTTSTGSLYAKVGPFELQFIKLGQASFDTADEIDDLVSPLMSSVFLAPYGTQ